MKKYIIWPGYVRSKTDGDWHFISADTLMRLYNVPKDECYVCEYVRPLRGIDTKKLIHLGPRYNGIYPDMNKNKEKGEKQ